MIVQQNQKRILFEEAARVGLRSGNLFSVGEIYRNLLGQSDLDAQYYGQSLAPFYKAEPGYNIDVARIKSFFTGLERDLKVFDLTATQLEDQLIAANLEFWHRNQLLKNRALKLTKIANQERFRNTSLASWVFTESFNDVNTTDLNRSTVAFDSAEGCIFIPALKNQAGVTNKSFSISNLILPTGNNTLGSKIEHAFDGLASTNFRCLFTDNTSCSFELTFEETTPINQITIDPVGFGINVVISAWVDNTWSTIISSVVYNRVSFPVDTSTTKIKISFASAENSLPKTGGIRELIISKEIVSEQAEWFSLPLQPATTFRELKVDYNLKDLASNKVTFFYATASGGPFKPVGKDTWVLANSSNVVNTAIDFTQSQPSNSFGGLFESNTLPGFIANLYAGELEIGKNQVEVVAARVTDIDPEDPFVVPKLTDFNIPNKKAWSNIPRLAVQQDSRLLQNYNATTLNSLGLRRGGSFFLGSRVVASTIATEQEQGSSRLFIVPMLGNGTNVIQSDYIYKLKFMVYAPKRFYFGDARAWFFQGHKAVGTKPFSQLGRTYGSYAIYLNGQLVASDNQPATIFQDNTLEQGADLGKPFAMTFEEGWNVYEILLNTIDPINYGSDSFTSPNSYLQLEIFPNIYDLNFTSQVETTLTNFIGSGNFKPVAEFDLLWNLPTDPVFWAWSSSRNKIMFNTNTLGTIDGFFKGLSPAMVLNYSSAEDLTTQEIYLRALLQRSAAGSPVIDSCTLMVR